MVINKPAGLVVHPGAGNWSGTLLNGLLHHCPQLANVPRAGIVHRLDKDTSGLMVVGKTLEAQTDLVRQLQARTVKREYFALVWGTPRAAGTIDAPIGRDAEGPRQDGGVEQLRRPSRRSRTTSCSPPACWTAARSAWCSASSKPAARTRSACTCSRLGFALVGDAVYGKQHLTPVFPRQALQARRLGLAHPATGEDCEWIVPLADRFRRPARATPGSKPEPDLMPAGLTMHPCPTGPDAARACRRAGHARGAAASARRRTTTARRRRAEPRHARQRRSRTPCAQTARGCARMLPGEPAWISQVHGAAVVDAASVEPGQPVRVADASIATRRAWSARS